MSAEATGYVFRSSQHSGSAFIVHLAIADSVNDQHGHSFWMSVASLSKKARVSERAAQYALRQLVDAGDLVVTKPGGGKGKPTGYRFLFRETVQGLHPCPNDTVQSAHPNGAESDTKGAGVAPEPKRTPTQELQPNGNAPAETVAFSSPGWDDLEDIRRFLTSLNGLLPKGFPVAQFDDPAYWHKLDALTAGTKTYYLDELKEYLVWWGDQPPSKRHKKVTKGFDSWVRIAMARERGRERNAKKQARR